MPPVQKVNTNLTTLIEQLGAIAEAWIGVPSIISGIGSNIEVFMSETHASLEGIQTQLADMQATFGVAAGGPETTMASLLLQIQSNTSCAQPICGPGPDDVGGCSAPFVSIGTVAGTDYGGRSFAVWNLDELPTGIVEGHFMDPEIANVQLVHDVAGIWGLFVASQGSTTFSMSPALDTVYPTNQWIDISANLDLAINTPTGTDVKAYICTPEDFPFIECVDVDSSAVTYENDQGETHFELDCQGIEWVGLTGISFAPTMQNDNAPPQIEGLGVGDGVMTNDGLGMTIKLVSGTAPVTIAYVSTSGARSTTTLDAVDAVYEIPVNTRGILVANVAVSSPVSHPFTIRLCPAEPE